MDFIESVPCVYPDSGKIMIYNLSRLILREDESIDYWDGERAGEPLPRRR